MAKSNRPRSKLYTLSDVAEATGLSTSTLRRYIDRHPERIPWVGEGRRRRYPPEALQIFERIKSEYLSQRKQSEDLLTLREISEKTGISYPTLLRWVKVYLERIPHRGLGRARRFYPEAVAVFEQLRELNMTRRGRPRPSGAYERAKAKTAASK